MLVEKFIYEPNIFSTSFPSTISSKISQNLFFSRRLSGIHIFFPDGHSSGGGKDVSRPILRVCSKSSGIKLLSREQFVSKHGLVLIQISQGCRSESIIKSMPKSQKLFCFLYLSRDRQVALTASRVIYFILGMILSKKVFFSSCKTCLLIYLFIFQ